MAARGKRARKARPALRVVGLRITSARKSVGISQKELAELLGITTARLGSYEEGRVPLKHRIGNDICRICLISQRWLATGYGDQFEYRDISIGYQVPEGESFVDFYEKHLGDVYESPNVDSGFSFVPRPDDSPRVLGLALVRCLGEWAGKLDAESRANFVYRLMVHGDRMADTFPRPGGDKVEPTPHDFGVVIKSDGREEPFDYKRYFLDLLDVSIDRPIDWMTLRGIISTFTRENARRLEGRYPTTLIARFTAERLSRLDRTAFDRYASKFLGAADFLPEEI